MKIWNKIQSLFKGKETESKKPEEKGKADVKTSTKVKNKAEEKTQESKGN